MTVTYSYVTKIIISLYVYVAINYIVIVLADMSDVVMRGKAGAPATGDDANDLEFGSSPPVIHELKNYHPFASTKSFRFSRIRRDSFVAEHRSVGVFTSGGDASGNFSAALFLSGLALKCLSFVFDLFK